MTETVAMTLREDLIKDHLLEPKRRAAYKYWLAGHKDALEEYRGKLARDITEETKDE